MSIFTRSLAVVIMAALTMPSAALAQDRGSEADQEACTPDVFRLCQDEIPDESRIVACLQAKGPSLSGACHAVMFRSSSAPNMRETDVSTTASIAGRHRRHRHHILD